MIVLGSKFGNFGAVYDYVFPVWGGAMVTLILFLECRKQITKVRGRGQNVEQAGVNSS